MANVKTSYTGKALVVAIAYFCGAGTIFAQDKILVVQGAPPNLYIAHTIEPKENYYSIGRMYNVPPKELAPYNNLDFAKGLSLGQEIKIPLAPNNFTQEAASKNVEALIPLYHIVEEKEGLYRVSVNYNKVPLQLLKKWNNLSSDAVSNGTKIIIGFLKVQKGQSSLTKNDANVATNVATETKANESHAVNNSTVQRESDAPVKNSTSSKVPGPESKAKPSVTDNIAGVKSVPATKTGVAFNDGRFKTLYQDQQQGRTLVSETGFSGVFKSTSGWQDGKYYCFHNGAQPGTIVKIMNTANDKVVYAKVLDLIPDINQNSGLMLHISNSAAQELGVTDNRFNCTINYYK